VTKKNSLLANIERYADTFIILGGLHAIAPLLVPGLGVCNYKNYVTIFVAISIPFMFSYVPKRLRLEQEHIEMKTILDKISILERITRIISLEVFTPLSTGVTIAYLFKKKLLNNDSIDLSILLFISEYFMSLFMFIISILINTISRKTSETLGKRLLRHSKKPSPIVTKIIGHKIIIKIIKYLVYAFLLISISIVILAILFYPIVLLKITLDPFCIRR
jgi:hypothetical protein